MRFRRRRKPRVVWLPGPGTQLDTHGGFTPLDPPQANPAAIEFAFDSSLDNPVTVNAPLVIDNPPTELFTGGSLTVWRQNNLNNATQLGYRLRRVVGDFFAVAFNANDQATQVAGVLLSAGIMVRRVDEATGLMTADGDVQSINNIADPWIWRRTWALGGRNEGSRLASETWLDALPEATTDYGTKWHQGVDQKTARRIGPEERLFLSVTANPLPLNRTTGGDGNGFLTPLRVWFLFDYRILATLGWNSGNRRNASR